jgi:hypothetical protein
MSEYALAQFLQRLLADELAPAGPLRDGAVLVLLIEQPAPVLQQLLGLHLDAMLARWPGGAALRPAAIPATALWAAAALNNLAWAATRPDPRLLTATLRLADALPAAETLEAALAYHCLLRRLDGQAPGADWQPVVRRLLDRSPLTAAWLPSLGERLRWPLLLELLQPPPLRAALRDRLLGLLPAPEALSRIDGDTALANAEAGRLLAGIAEHGGPAWQPFLLELYEADCLLGRRGSDERPTWPHLEWIRQARLNDDKLLQRRAERLLERYRPLVPLLADPELVRRYLYLDGAFLQQIAALQPASRLRMRRVA